MREGVLELVEGEIDLGVLRLWTKAASASASDRPDPGSRPGTPPWMSRAARHRPVSVGDDERAAAPAARMRRTTPALSTELLPTPLTPVEHRKA